MCVQGPRRHSCPAGAPIKTDRRLTPLLDRYARDGKVIHQEARSLLFFPARSSDPDAKPYAADNYGDRGGHWANLLWNLPDQPAGGAVRSILQSSDRFFLSDHPKRTMPAYIQGPDGKPQLAARVTFAYGYVKANNGEKIWGWRVWQHEVKQADDTWKKVDHQQKV